MKINQRSAEELAQALQKVQDALAVQSLTKATIVKTLAAMGWCSVNSTGIEKTFLAAVKAAGLAVKNPFAKVMGVGEILSPAKKAHAEPPTVTPTTTASKPAVAKAYEPPVDPETAINLPTKLADGDFTVLNLKAVSVIEASSGNESQITFIGSKTKLTGGIDDSSLRSNCSLIEFAI